MSKIILMLIGPSGCGKSTLEKGLTADQNIKKVVSVTTRPPRDGEVDGVDYNFVSDQYFQALSFQNKLVQTTEFADNKYGTTLSEYTTEHDVATLCVVPYSAANFKPVIEEHIPGVKVRIVYFDISQDRLIQNMRARGDTEVMITKRIAQDDLKQQMIDSGLIADYTITDDTLNENTLSNVFEWIQTQL